ncbi:Na+-transporting methylmalonyl-CoA/oxaloacetate decarboxylase gamma subunit [Haloferula luteola]|uniref:Na+-transporting methylmalonyl-CoA/oxaloacetate decarboxylase gamma subunit n=1 Tax=Haloferula luteola TaxID=595692 RepID=A0A840V2F0_9BACT|nr:OadG family transporter subunit [Haloferula luteola]MBB5352477.1 Na+-transporting methylmalonyl-CoA/oxaloacetate decarboxylase gamma subunit [Haloferula luteola]
MIPILANLPTHPTINQSLEFLLVGQVLVLFVLGVLMLFITLNGLAFSRAPKPKPAVAPTASAPLAAPVPVTGNEAIPAVIAAAVHIALEGQPHQIVYMAPSRDGWAHEGRRQIFSSHRVR